MLIKVKSDLRKLTLAKICLQKEILLILRRIYNHSIMSKHIILCITIMLSFLRLNAQTVYVDGLQVGDNLVKMISDAQENPKRLDYRHLGDSIASSAGNNDDVKIAGLLLTTFPMMDDLDTAVVPVLEQIKSLTLHKHINIYYEVANMEAVFYLNSNQVQKAFFAVRNFSKMASNDNNPVGKLLSYLTAGEIFIFRNSVHNAQNCYRMALSMAKQLGARRDILYIYLQYVNTFDLQENYDSSSYYMSEAIQFAKDNLEDFDYIQMRILSLTYGDNRTSDEFLRDYRNLASKYDFRDYVDDNDYYWIQSYYHIAENRKDSALMYCDSIAFGAERIQAKEEVYKRLGLMDSAYVFRCQADMFNDSVQTVMQNADFAAIEAEFNNAELRFQAKEMEMRQRRIISLAVGGIVFLVVGFIVFRAIETNRRIRKEKEWMEGEIKRQTAEIKNQNEEIMSQNEEIMSQNEEILAQNNQISIQRDQLERSNNEIKSSIRYASRMQLAAVPSANYMKSIWGNDLMIFWRPLDIVSGDFYCGHQDARYKYLVVADCTGHGVPGAFMSMLGISIISYVVNQMPDASAGDILTEIRRYVIHSLNQTDDLQSSKDGMDLGLVKLDPTARTLEFAGAKRPLIIVRDGNIYEYEPDKMPIGIYKKLDSFKTQNVDYQPGDWLYMYSDGIQDQFGWQEGRGITKFSQKRLKAFLAENYNRSADEQSILLSGTIDSWRQCPDGKIESQIDDEIIVGVRL